MNPYITNDLAQLVSTQDFLSSNLFMRRSLLASMVAGRKSIRFLLAPDGYGKSSLALAYAKLAFGLKSFWWVDAQDPRFLLDLDFAGTSKANELTKIASKQFPSLMVFDAVPALSKDRENSFSEILMHLVSLGWEVLVTSNCVSLSNSVNSYFKNLPHRKDISKCESQSFYASDLLLSEDEMKQLSSPELKPLGVFDSAVYIPCFILGRTQGRKLFLKELAAQASNQTDILAIISLILRPGQVSDLQCFYSGDFQDCCQSLIRDAPHAGITSLTEPCSAVLLTPEERLYVFKQALPKFKENSDKDIVALLVRTLLKRGETSLAGRLMAAGKDSAACKEFLDNHALEFLYNGDFLALLELSRTAGECSYSFSTGLTLACACMGLNDSVGALRELDSLSLETLTPLENSICALLRSIGLIRNGLGDKEEIKARIKSIRWLISNSSHESSSLAVKLAWASIWSSAKFSELPGYLRALYNSGDGYESLLAAAWLVLVAMRQGRARRSSEALAELFCDLAKSLDAEHRPGVFDCVLDAYLRFLYEDKCHKVCGERLFERSAVIKEQISREAGIWEASRKSKERRVEKTNKHVSADTSALNFMPIKLDTLRSLEVKGLENGSLRLFGGFELRLAEAVDTEFSDELIFCESEISQGHADELKFPDLNQLGTQSDKDKEKAELSSKSSKKSRKAVLIEHPQTKLARLGDSFVPAQSESLSKPIRLRAKGQLLMSLLALNHDKEVSREWLTDALWSSASEHSKRVSFYSLWSYLTRTVRAYDCMQFLNCNKYAASLQGGIIFLDIQMADQICKRLEEESISFFERMELLGRLRQLYRGPLLPGVKHKEIALVRTHWEHRIVDIFLSSADLMDSPVDLPVLEDHLSFAFDIDPTRQDLAYALMRVQRMLGQHAQATETFIRCQRESLELHGLGANARLKDLYQDVLADVS